jgi:peptide methionine sulfoxide reductase msrA/msrB
VNNKILLTTLVVIFSISTITFMFSKFTKSTTLNLNTNNMPVQQNTKIPKNAQTAYFAGGCFWCIEASFQETPGVVDAISGYAGGQVENPSYEQVTNGTTGHRESVKVVYDPDKVTYSQLVELFFKQIDPTDAEGQFADKGFQYTTAIYYLTDQEKKIAEEHIEYLESTDLYDKPIVTKVLPFTNFYKASDYHQDFYKNSAKHYEAYKKGSGRQSYTEYIKQKFIELEKQESNN